jgi:hypothetical protein
MPGPEVEVDSPPGRKQRAGTRDVCYTQYFGEAEDNRVQMSGLVPSGSGGKMHLLIHMPSYAV